MEPSESLINEILSGHPSQETLFLVLSRMKKHGLLERVIEECAKALEIYPDDIRIRRLLAESCFETGRISRAESEIETVITKVNEQITSFRLQADIFISQGKKAEALEALKLYLLHHPEDRDSFILLESMQTRVETPSETMKAGQVMPFLAEEIEPSFEEALPDIATATLAEVYFNQGKTREAIATYEKVVEQNPEDLGSRLRLDELKAMLEQDQLDEDKKTALVMRKEKMISTLESWLDGIREQKKAGISIS